MEELIKEVKELGQIINENAVPQWINIVGIVVPIFISIMVVVITIIQHKKNKQLQVEINKKSENLQRELSKKEIKVQMHSDIMKIYDDFSIAQKALLFTGGKSHVVFSNFNNMNGIIIPMNYVTGINMAANTLSQAINRAMLLLPKQDKEFRDLLKTILEKYINLYLQVNDYFNSGIAYNVSNIAWQQICQIYSNIPLYDFSMLIGNQQAYNTYLEKCRTETTVEIDEKTTELLELFKYEKFDVYFEKYLKMDIE
ncbi:MAG: hypothetical protein ACI4VW_00550 [Acutalibacteraceae bacterium]